MAFHISVKVQSFMLLIWLQLISAEIPTNASRPIAKPGCVDKCGNVSIPYPFGIGDGRILEEWFELRCNNIILVDHPKPPLEWFELRCNNIILVDHPKPINGGLYVSEISLLGGHLITDVSISTDCSRNKIRNFNYSITDSFLGKFTFSATKNKLTAIGCNSCAYLGLNSRFFPAAGCMSMCNTVVNSHNGSCTGSGCCHASIPVGLKEFTLTVAYLNEMHPESSFNPCTYAFLHEESSFKFSTSYLKNFKANGTESVPVAIDWKVGTQTCREAQRNLKTYACGIDSVEGIDPPGYLCQCEGGHEGNPYLNSTTGGHCQDINECEASSNPCVTGICINIKGSFECRCPEGEILLANLNDGISYCSRPPLSKVLVAVIVSTAASILIILILCVGYWLYKRIQKRQQIKLKQGHFKRNGGLLLKQKIISNDGKVESTAKIFVAEELEKTTDNFNPSRIIGKGGFGTVFKGMLSNGEIVAIKKSTLVDETQVSQFINEVAILSQINHRHIVKLLGCCLETQVPLLVYEFVPHGTLSYHLHEVDGDNESLLSWKDRVRMASEIAGALAYLHSQASMPIFHRDIKSTNILLDEKYKAKVSDFGISRSAHIDSTHLTTRVQGTFGYLDPEYFHSSQFTDKSDVYSFGVVLVELLTGEKAISNIREEGLALYFIKSLKENRLSEILDARVLNEGDSDDVLVVGKLAKKCLKYVGKKRPTMKEVSHSLEGLHEKFSKDSEQPSKLRQNELHWM